MENQVTFSAWLRHSSTFGLQNDSVLRDLKLIREKTELLVSRLHKWNIIFLSNNACFHCHQKLSHFYSQEDTICFCKDINGLTQKISFGYNFEESVHYVDEKEALKCPFAPQ